MGKAKKHRKEAAFQAVPWETADLARQHEWASLKDVLGRTGVAKRTFESWRGCQLIPEVIKPAEWRNPGARGGFEVLWPPELEAVLRDARHMSGSLHMRGQRHRLSKQEPTVAHAALRIGLWIRGWEYDTNLLKQTLASVIDQFGKIIRGQFTLSDFVRWLYASARAYEPTGARDDPSRKRPRGAWGVESVWRFILFTHRVSSWVGVTLGDYDYGKKISGFWTGNGTLTHTDLKAFLREIGGHELDRLRNGWRKILNALMFQSSPDPFSVEPPFDASLMGISVDESLETGLIWQTIQSLDKDAHHVTTHDEFERWAAQWEKIKHTIPEEKRANIMLDRGSAWNTLTGQRVAELERTYRPTNFAGVIAKLLKYLGVMMLLIAGHQGADVVTEGAASRPYEPTKGLFCPRCHVALEPEPAWPPLWERLRKPRPIEHQRCPTCLVVWVIPDDPQQRKVFQVSDEVSTTHT